MAMKSEVEVGRLGSERARTAWRRCGRCVSLLRIALVFTFLLPFAAAGVELAPGDLVGLGGDLGLVRLDPNTGAATAIPDVLDVANTANGAFAVAVTPDPRDPTHFLVWIANQSPGPSTPGLLALDPQTGLPVATCGADGIPVYGIASVPGKPVLYSVGSLLIRHRILMGPTSLECVSDPPLSNLEADAGGIGGRVALFALGSSVARAAILIDAAQPTIVAYDAATGAVSPIPISLTAQNLIFDVAYNQFGALYFTALTVLGFPPTCSDSGVFVVGHSGTSLAASGGYLTECIGSLASNPGAATPTLFVTSFGYGAPGQIVKLVDQNGSFVQSLLANDRPTDLEVVPEAVGPDAALAAVAGLAMLVAHTKRRLQGRR